MGRQPIFCRSIVWALIFALANPAVFTPWAHGRDTDIFLGVTTAPATAEPNILLLLDTSDSMNHAEGWREYPGEYDSHIEYLWNDPAYINSITTTAPNADLTNVGSSPNNYFVTYSGSCPNPANPECPRDSGYFAGTDDMARAALRTAVLAHANGTHPGDPGARSIYRNYNDASWVYWLPAGTDESDRRLWSVAFNRFAGGIRVSNFSSTSGNPAQVVRAGVNFGATRDFTVGSALRTPSNSFNQCTASMEPLLPSTVYAPTEYGRNSGKWLNQQWVRWERWLNLENSRAAAYPGSHALIAIAGTSRRAGYVGAPYNASVTPFPGPTDPRVDPPSATEPGVSAPPAPSITASRDDVGSNGFAGQPIRVQNDNPPKGFANSTSDSHAGWTVVKADLGGYIYQPTVGGMAQSVLQNLRGVYGHALLTVTGASALENERFSAWRGNRDAAEIPFGMSTGTPAYYNVRGSDLPQTSGADAVTCTRPCGLAPGAAGPTGDGVDGVNTPRQYYQANASGQYCAQTGPLTGNCAAGEPPQCAFNNVINQFVSQGHSNCTWTGRQSRFFEGVGTVFFGGTCQGECRGAGFVLGGPNCPSGGTNTSYCNQPSASNDGVNWLGTYTIDGVTYNNVTKNAIGTCSSVVNTIQNCEQRKGFPCVYSPAPPSTFCPDRTSTTFVGGSLLNYPVYIRNDFDNNLVHDCKADEAALNGGASVYMTAQKRDFNLTFNTNSSTSGTTAAYTTNAAHQTNPPAIDLYSVNYLNWKYGAKGPNGHPVGRKTRLQIAKDALADLIATTDGVRFGLMTFNALPENATLRPSQGSQGGKIVFPIRRMGSNANDPDFANRAALIGVINKELAKAATPLSESLYEAYLYFSGRAPRYGTSAAITANFGADALPAVGGGTVTDGADASAVSSGRYVSPMLNNPSLENPAACQKNFVILITDGGPEFDSDTNELIPQLAHPTFANQIAPDTRIDTINAATTTGQFETGGVPYGPPSTGDTLRADGGYVWLDELAYFMNRADVSPNTPHRTGETGTDALVGTQNVVTYTIGFAGADTPVLANTAQRGGGAYYVAEDSAQLAAALTDALIQIRQWNPTIAAPTVPLSALNRAQNAADVYLAFFAPAPSQAWRGTLKRFRIGTGAEDCGPDKELCLIGKTVLSSGVRDVERTETDPVTGFSQVIVDRDAVSFWNPITLSDGSEPTVGGTGHQLISTSGYTPATRRLYTYITAGATSTLLTDASNAMSEDNSRVSKAVLGDAAMSDAGRSRLINFIRGGNIGEGACSDATSATPCTEWRAWPHADVQHSRPLIVTYNSTPTADAEAPGAERATSQYLFYLTNDGLVHAIDAATGQEKWAFLVEEALTQISAVAANMNGPSLDLADGSPVAWIDRGNNDGIVNGSERVWMFFGLRRGGRVYYALDITDINTPRFMWKITPTQRCNLTSCNATSEFAQLGQSWSTPVVGRVAATTGMSGARPNGNQDPVVMFGGGYDPQQDTHPLPDGTTQDTMGKGVFIVEGSNGALVKSFTNVGSDFLNASGIQWSIPSDLTVINADLDALNFLDRIVVGDAGGNLWRFDIGATDATTWRGKKLAELSDSGVPNRKILFPPVVVPQRAPYPVEWHAVYVGTGDREHPLALDTSDKMFMIADFDIGLNATAGPPASFAAGDLLGLAEGDVGGVVPTALVTKRGWYRSLEPGEKVTGAPFVFNQKLRFSTYAAGAMNSATCLPPGEGRLNEINALYGHLLDLNGDGVTSARDRYYAGVSRGYFSPLQSVIIGGTVYTIALAGGSVTQTAAAPAPPAGATSACQAGAQFWYCREQRIGIAQRIYWYMEPEQ